MMTQTYLDRIRYPDELSELEQLSLIDVSYSRLNSMLDDTWGCGLKYFYQYILKIPSESGAKAILGNMIHEALEHSLDNDKDLDEVTLMANYEVAQKVYDPDGDLVDDDLIRLGGRMLREFFERHKKERWSSRLSIYPKILGKELPFEIVIGTGKIRGFIDLAYELGDTIYFRDYKSGKHEVPDDQVPTNMQLGIYGLVMRKLYPDKKLIGSLYYLQSATEKTHKYTDEELEEILYTLEDQISNLVHVLHFQPTQKKFVCKGCSYAKDGTCPTGRSRIKR